jgi:Arylsulfotransferase (ASST)
MACSNRAAGLRRCWLAPVLTATLFAFPVAGALAQPGPVSVFPIPGSRVALPATQIVFRGIPAASIGSVQVVGSRSGAHAGTIEADSDGQGGSFIPAQGFSPGETVTVRTGLDVRSAANGLFQFTIARPAGAIPPAPLPRVSSGRHGVQHFQSRPDLLPPSISVTKRSAPTGLGDIFLAPQFGPAQDGPMLLDPAGNLIWFDPTSFASKILTTDFRVQQLGSQPVLTWWRGYTNDGSGRGEGVIFNDNYRQVGVVKAGDGLQMDLHEFLVTPQGDAYFLAVSPVHWPGVRRPVLDSAVQEVDIRTGLVLFEWHALDHIPLADSYFGSPKTTGHLLDPFHLNSISLESDGNLIISARNTYTVYNVSHAAGAVIWRLGGKRSTLTMGRGTTTALQHDAVVQPDGTLTMFDDGAGPPKVHSESRALRVAVNLATRTATLTGEYFHHPALSADFEGSAQGLPGGDTFVGWGQQPYFSEFDPRGNIDLDAHFVAPTSSYRAYRLPWTGHPVTFPAVAATHGRRNTTTVYASWNGATDVASWRVLAGSSPTTLAPAATVAKNRFETEIGIRGAQRYIAVQPLDAQGATLATSHTVAVR